MSTELVNVDDDRCPDCGLLNCVCWYDENGDDDVCEHGVGFDEPCEDCEDIDAGIAP